MASTTKIVGTRLLVLEHFHDLATVIKAPRDAVGVGEDEIYLVKGEKLPPVDQLLPGAPHPERQRRRRRPGRRRGRRPRRSSWPS